MKRIYIKAAGAHAPAAFSLVYTAGSLSNEASSSRKEPWG